MLKGSIFTEVFISLVRRRGYVGLGDGEALPRLLTERIDETIGM